MSKFHEAPLDELLGSIQESTKTQTEAKERSFEETMKAIMQADMERMLREGWDDGEYAFPDSVKPLWKN